jgi:peptide/nickel transport system permease protein
MEQPIDNSDHIPHGISPTRQAWQRFRRSRMAVVGAVIVAIMLFVALFAPLIAPYSYRESFEEDGVVCVEPSAKHWFGLDRIDRDMLSRLIYGARVSLSVAVVATAISLVVGVLVGAVAGYVGGWVDEGLMRVADTFSAFPGILLGIALAAAIGKNSIVVVFFALGAVGWPALARIVRGQVLSVKVEAYVDAARALGARPSRVLFRHVLANCVAPVIVAVTVMMAGNLLGEAGLGFLGIGVEAPYPSWGMMLSEVKVLQLADEWWRCVVPGLAISLTVLGFNLLGDGLRDTLDPRLRK